MDIAPVRLNERHRESKIVCVHDIKDIHDLLTNGQNSKALAN